MLRAAWTCGGLSLRRPLGPATALRGMEEFFDRATKESEYPFAGAYFVGPLRFPCCCCLFCLLPS